MAWDPLIRTSFAFFIPEEKSIKFLWPAFYFEVIEQRSSKWYHLTPVVVPLCSPLGKLIFYNITRPKLFGLAIKLFNEKNSTTYFSPKWKTFTLTLTFVMKIWWEISEYQTNVILDSTTERNDSWIWFYRQISPGDGRRCCVQRWANQRRW